jgi:hypothetical protein
MPRRDQRVTEYIRQCAPFARPILRHLRKTIHAASPCLEETLKWRMPTFLHEGKIVCGIAGFKAHCALWFWKGKTVVGKKPQAGMGNFGKITSVGDLPSETEIKRYVGKAMALIDRGR